MGAKVAVTGAKGGGGSGGAVGLTSPLRSQSGVTLLELLVAIGIMTVLMSMGTMAFSHYREKAAIEAEARELYADLMNARAEALFRKESRSVKLTGASQLAVYATSDGSGDVLWGRDYSYRKAIVSSNANPVAFDSTGMADSDKAFCVGPAGNDAGADSVVISTTSVLLGKLNGGNCTSANISPK